MYILDILYVLAKWKPEAAFCKEHLKCDIYVVLKSFFHLSHQRFPSRSISAGISVH